MANLTQMLPPAWKGLRLPFAGKLKARRPGPITALDLDGRVLRVAQTVPRGQRTAIQSVAVVTLELAPDANRSDPVALGKAIAEALDRLRIKPGPVVMGVPRHLVVLRTLSLPMLTDFRELASMVHLQIGKDLPFRQDEAVIDFKIRRQVEPQRRSEGNDHTAKPEPAVAAPKLEVLVAAIKRELVEFYQKTAAAAKLKLVALGWLSQANARCLEACQIEGDQAMALVSLRPDEVGIDILAEQSLLFSRGASIKLRTGHDDPSPPPSEPASAEEPEEPLLSETGAPPPPERFVEAVTIEVVRSLHSYSGAEPHAPVTRLIVAGATGHELEVIQALQERLKIPAALLDPGDALELPNAARQHAPGAVGAIGLGLGVNDPEGLPFDFLNPKRPAVQRNLRRIRTLALTTGGVALLVVLLGVRSHLLGKRQLIYDQVQAELKDAEKKLPLYRQMQRQALTLQSWAKQSRNWLDHYAYLSAVLPGSEEIYLTSISISAQGNIHLAVQARSGETLAKLDRQLRAAGYEVKPLAINPGKDKFGYNFRSTVELIVPPTIKIDLSKAQPPPRPEDDGSLDNLERPQRKGGRS